MAKLFYAEANVHEVRGILEVIKNLSKRGPLRVSVLASETGKNIDALLPILEAAEELELCRIESGGITLTASGNKLNSENYKKVIKDELLQMEPFLTARDETSYTEPLATVDLSRRLSKRGVNFSTNERQNEDTLRHILFKWGAGFGLFTYDGREDSWKKAR